MVNAVGLPSSGEAQTKDMLPAPGATHSSTISGFSHVTLLVTDIDAARRFYVDVLGLDELPRPDVLGAGAWFRVGDRQLHLGITDAMPKGTLDVLSHIAFHVDSADFEHRVHRIEERGGVLVREVRSRADFGVTVRAAFLRDPFGNLIELTDVGALSD